MKASRYLELTRDLLTRPGSPQPTETHLREALAWIYRAQDVGGDRGVSHSYEIGRGWLPSYPETTGYIIPTLLNIWKGFGDQESRRRALEMAEWELRVQLPNGAIPDLATKDPVIFDTGQVLFGWLAAFEATGEERYLDAGRRAGDWLVGVMDEDGAWRRFTGSSVGGTFNARAAWGLAELGRATGSEAIQQAARRFFRWSLGRERGRGWFEANCLTDNDQPLLHTIAYTAEGQLEAGLLLDDPLLMAAASRTAGELANLVDPGGRMAGRFDREWRPTVRWACLTGMAQTCVVWSRLHANAPDPPLAEAAARVLAFLKGTHDLSSRNEGLRGGIRGSFPVNGAYCRYRVPNWASKFFLDAILHAPDTGQLPAFKG